MSDPHHPPSSMNEGPVLPRPTSSLPPAPETDPLPRTTPLGEGSDRTLAPPTPEAPSALRLPSVTLPPRTGRYAILGEIARGGMGAVLLARDEDLDRQLAIKVPFDGFEDRPESVRRFLDEARVGGRLQHPGIVPIYELGRFDDQRPYFTMKLVQGRTLAALFAERDHLAHDLPRFLKVFEQVCQTLAYAHARGVIHRDLKPDNIMVGEFGEVQVMDWGLAKVLRAPAREAPTSRPETAPLSSEERNIHATQAGMVMGTLAYMPPEQARGEIDSLDERCDVFGLGAILCTTLTGRPPYAGDQDAVRDRATRGDLTYAFARLDACQADADLLWLAKSCLAADPDRRPRDAGVVALTVTSYLAGVQERLREAEIERAAAQAKADEARAKAAAERHARRLTLGLAAVLLLGAGLTGGGWAWLEGRRAETTAAVNQALLDATRLREQARAADVDLLKWTEAVGAMHKAQALAAGGHADAELLARVEEGLAAVKDEEHRAGQRIREAEKQRRMLARFEDVRLRMSDQFRESNAEFARAARECHGIFKENDLDIDALPVEAGAARIRALPLPVAQAVVGAVDDWVFAEWADYWTTRQRKSPKGTKVDAMSLLLGGDPVLMRNLKVWRRRLSVAQEADADPLRKRLRGTLTRLELGKFKQIVESEDVAELPAPTVRVMAEILYALGEVRRGTDILRQALQRKYAGDFWLNYRLAVFSALGSPPALDEAVRYGSAAVALRPGCGEALRLVAWALKQKGDVDGSIAAYRQALRAQPDDAYTCGQIGSLYYLKRNYKEAAAWHRKAVGLKPDNFIQRLNLGTSLWNAGDLAGAADAYRAAAQVDPADERAPEYLGKVLLKQGKVPEATAAFAQAARLKPGSALDADGDLGAAIAAYREVLRRWPGDQEAHRRLSVALYRHGEGRWDRQALAEAVGVLAADLRSNRSPVTSFQLADALQLLGDEGRAVAYLTNPAEPLAARTATFYTALLALKGRGDAYRGCCAALLKRFGRTGDADEALQIAWCLAQAPGAGTDPAEAVRLAEQAVKAKPRSARALLALALAHHRAGRPEQAVERANEALKAAPAWNPSLSWLVLALAHQRLGRADEAHRWLDRAVEAGAPPEQPSQEQLLYWLLRREARGQFRAAAAAPK